MARVRSLKPHVWQDRALGRCSIGARLLFIGLITQADDEGRFRAEAPLLRAAIFPWDTFEATADALPGLGFVELDVDAWLRELEEQELVRTWDVKGQRYGDLRSWARHQVIRHPSPSTIPGPEKRSKRQSTRSHAGDSRKATAALPRSAVTRTLKEEKEKEKDKSMSSSQAARPARVTADHPVFVAYLEHHPRATFTTEGKNHRRGLIERALKMGKPVDELVAAVHGIHTSDYHLENGHAANLELTLRDADHIERYAAMWEPWASKVGAVNGAGRNAPTSDELAAAERAMGG